MEGSAHTLQKEKTCDPRQEIMDQLLKIRDSVSDYTKYLSRLISYLQSCCQKFTNERVAAHIAAWRKLTSDSFTFNRLM